MRLRISCKKASAACAIGWASAAAALPSGAQPTIANEFQVNTYTTNGQGRPAVAEAANGTFIVAWHSHGSFGTDTSAESIQGQRYAKNQATAGAQFQINTYTTSYQYSPAISADADGDFVVVWESIGSAGSDTTGYSIQGQRFASNGSPHGTQFQVNSYATGNQHFPLVASDADGDFVVVWQSEGSPGTDTNAPSIQGQRYASNGSALGAQFQVNTYTTSLQSYPSVGVAPNGDFVVVWGSRGSPGSDASGMSIQAQRYASNGTALGSQLQVNTYTTSEQGGAHVAVAANGSFVVVWESVGSSGTDTTGLSIQGQRYASNGEAQGAQFQVNSYTTDYQVVPVVAVDADGDFVVAWESDGSAGTDTSDGSVQGQRYASSGSPQGAQFQVNTYTTGYQYRPAIAADATRNFVIVWYSNGSLGTDTSGNSIQGQLYGTPTLAVPAISPLPRLALAAALMLLGATSAMRRRS